MLINCVAYQDGKKLADISIEAISDYIQIPGCFVWVAMSEASDTELAVMQEEFGLHELAVEDARRGHQRAKIEEYGDSLFVVMQTVERNGQEITEGEVAIFVGVNYVLSVRSQVARGFLGVRARAEREPELLAMGSSFVLYALMDAVVDRYFPVIDLLESRLETIEERIFIKGEQRANIQLLYELKAEVLSMRHSVGPLIDAVGKLHGGRVPSFCYRTQDYFRDVHDHLFRIGASLDTARDTISTAIQVNLSMVAIDDGEVNKRLAAWAAIFAVFTAFAGVWGMNFKYMPELEQAWGYPAAITTMVCVCGYLYYRFRKSGWL